MRTIIASCFGVFAVFVVGAFAAQSTPSPAPVVSAVPSVCPVCPPCASATAGPDTLKPDEAKKLLSEFKKAQALEMKALEHRQKIELREMKASQKARLKEWELKEREARRTYFKEHTAGPDRRTYVQDFISRRKSMLSMMADEKKQRSGEHEARRKAIKDDQTAKMKEFQDSLAKMIRPANTLWPQAGR
jgi:hypothetical protein